MKLGFYYHIPCYDNGGCLFLPGYLGVFLDELAKNVEQLILIMHEATDKEIRDADYQLMATNVRFINLGPKTAAWHRTFFPKSILKKHLKDIGNCDAILVRCPSPLAVSFFKLVKTTKIFFLVVGDYDEAANQLTTINLKSLVLNRYLKYVDSKLLRVIKDVDTFVNSTLLFSKYSDKAKSLQLIKTTTLREDDFFQKDPGPLTKTIQLLYTGRIEFTKGLTELVEAVKLLADLKLDVHLNIVGWEANETKTYEKQLLQLAKFRGIEDKLTFHGKKKVGQELNAMYRKSDIYVIPSYHEGFPRTIWEAMANSLPVIATKVGAIPEYLEDKSSAILIEPKNVNSIFEAINLLINSSELRSRLIKTGYQLAKECSLPKQTKMIVSKIESFYE
ncbi:glycosyltransferase family 4 protein [uncultured Sphingobacterium sp.]|uniref:glycosyltransferase family 4 protein n=1 Tax=uncultured Sphingobacterium sp. TaxID=182688 RepID=UPI003748F852